MAEMSRVPPSSPEAEKSILGSMLLSEKCVYDALDEMRVEDFFQQRHRDIFRAMQDLFAAGVSVDFVTVTQKLEQMGKMQLGGVEYLSDLTQMVPSVANLAYYMDIVKQKSSLRRLIDVGLLITDDCYAESMEAEEIVGRAGDAIYKIAIKSSKSSLVHIKEALEETYLKLSAAMESKDGLMGVPTGFPRLDRTLSGLQGGQLIVIAGRPGMGKTSFALNIVEHLAMVKHVPCIIFSLEMAADQLAGRLLSAQAKVDSQNLRSGNVSEQDIHKIANAIKALKAAPVYIDDSALITATEMLAKAHRLKRSEDLGLIVIDYLQLMSGSGRAENRQQEISQLTRMLKVMSKELDLPIVLLSQLSRAMEKRDKSSRRPMLSDLRESGAIEQDADVVLFLHREDYYSDESAPENIGKAEIIIAKQRNGPTGSIPVKWIGEYTKYEEVDTYHTQPEY
jgi:replicative DNA helicase